MKRPVILLLFLLIPLSAAAQGNAAGSPSPPATQAHPYITVSRPAPPPDSDDGWSGSVAVYGFLSSFDGELRARDRVVEVERSFGDIADVLKFAAAVRVEARHGRWGVAFDNNHFKVGDDVTTDRLVTPDFRFDLAMNVAEIEPSYRIYEAGEQDGPVGGPEFAVDVIGGVRIVHIDTDLEIRRAIGDDVLRDNSATYVHGYVGNRVVVSPWRYLSLSARYNLSLASDLSWYAGGQVDVRPWEHFSFGGGIQALDLSLEEDSKDAALDARFVGPTVHMKFHF